jgi:hypothetical protein
MPAIHFLGGDGPEPPHEVSYADRPYLLEVERSWFEERFGDVQLPTVALTAVVCGRTVTIDNSS